MTSLIGRSALVWPGASGASALHGGELPGSAATRGRDDEPGTLQQVAAGHATIMGHETSHRDVSMWSCENARGRSDELILNSSSVGSLLRHEPQDLALVPVRHHIQRFVGTLLDAADALIEIDQQAFFRHDPLAGQHEAHEMLAGQRAPRTNRPAMPETACPV